MKVLVILLVFILGFYKPAWSKDPDNLGFTSTPAYINDQNTWYILTLPGNEVEFKSNPNVTLNNPTVEWSFTNGSRAHAWGSDVSCTYYTPQADGQANAVNFLAKRTFRCQTNKTVASVILIDVEFETSPDQFSAGTNNALVRVKNDGYPTKRFYEQCRMRLSAANALSKNITLYLKNPDGRLRFPEAGDTTKAINLSADGSWNTFRVTGESESESIGDAVLEVHKDSTSGDLLGKEKFTVYDFEPSEISVTEGSTYSIIGNIYQAGPNEAVYMKANAYLKPSGLDLNLKQLNKYYIGVCQNGKATTKYCHRIWSHPQISWSAGVPSGSTITVPSGYEDILKVPDVTNDSDSGSNPLYSQATGEITTPRLSQTDTNTAKCSDNPDAPCDVYTHKFYRAGNLVATVAYSIDYISFNASFKDWCVTYNDATQEVIPLKETGWNLKIETTTIADDQVANVSGTNNNPSSEPLTGEPYENDVLAATAKFGPAKGSHDVTFTAP